VAVPRLYVHLSFLDGRRWHAPVTKLHGLLTCSCATLLLDVLNCSWVRVLAADGLYVWMI
jgi:hypothetical protein